jgi:hypothetical protein
VISAAGPANSQAHARRASSHRMVASDPVAEGRPYEHRICEQAIHVGRLYGAASNEAKWQVVQVSCSV